MLWRPGRLGPCGHGVCVLVGTSSKKQVNNNSYRLGDMWCRKKKNGSTAGGRDQAARGVASQGDRERAEKMLSWILKDKEIPGIRMWLNCVPGSGSPLGPRYTVFSWALLPVKNWAYLVSSKLYFHCWTMVRDLKKFHAKSSILKDEIKMWVWIKFLVCSLIVPVHCFAWAHLWRPLS